MKERTLIYLSLAVSTAALCYAAWVHRHAEAMADAALRQREEQFVETLTPKVRQFYEGMGIASQATTLCDRWQKLLPEEKRDLIEIITHRIVLDKDEVIVNFYPRPSCKDMAKRWRKGWDSNPR